MRSSETGTAGLSGFDPLALISQIQDYAIIALGPDGRIQSWNNGAQRLNGYTEQQALGRHFSMLYTEADRQAGLPANMLDAARLQGRVDHRGWRARRDGSEFWGDVVLTALHDDEARLTGYAKITRDLTERHRLETSLRESESNFRELVRQVIDFAIIGLDTEGRIKSWNLGAQRLKGYSEDQALGQNFAMFYTEEDQLAGLPAQMLSIARIQGRVARSGWRVRRDGSTFWADVVITALHDQQGDLTGFAKVTRDLTERHRLETTLRDTKATFHELVSQVLGYVAAAAPDEPASPIDSDLAESTSAPDPQRA